MRKLWLHLADKDNRERLALIGTAIGAIAAGAFAAYKLALPPAKTHNAPIVIDAAKTSEWEAQTQFVAIQHQIKAANLFMENFSYAVNSHLHEKWNKKLGCCAGNITSFDFLISDVNSDELQDIVTTYVVEGEGGGNHHEQYLQVFFGKEDGEYLPLWSYTEQMIGSRVEGGVRLLDILGNRIKLERIYHAEEDPVCCPTKREIVFYQLSNGTLREVDKYGISKHD